MVPPVARRMSRRKRTDSRGQADLGRAVGRGALIGGAAFVLSLALASFLATEYAKGYLKSAAFREKMANDISRVLKARTELDPVSWNGFSAYTDRVRAQGHEEAEFGFIEIAGTRVDLDLSTAQFRRRVWKVSEVQVSQVVLDLSDEVKLPGNLPVRTEPADPLPEAVAPPRRTGLLADLLPDRLEVDAVRINNFNLMWLEDGRQAQAVGIQTIVTPSPTLDSFQVDARGGAVHRPGQPKLDIDRVNFRTKDGGVFLNTALFRTQQGAEVNLEGDILPGKEDRPGSLLLRAAVKHLKLADVVDEGWRQRVRGDVGITATLEGDPDHLAAAAATGTITLDNGILEALPILETLATYTGSERFRRVALRDGATARFTRQGKTTVIEGIDVQSDGLARLTGGLRIEEGALSGTLRLGVIPGTMTWLPGAEQLVFTDSRDGYLWTDVVLSGTVDSPRNDLVAKLASAGVETALETFMDPAARKESVEGALGVGRDILKGFLGR